MIKIDKTSNIPKKLLTEGRNETTVASINLQSNRKIKSACETFGFPPNKLKKLVIEAKKLYDLAGKKNSKFTNMVRCNFSYLPKV